MEHTLSHCLCICLDREELWVLYYLDGFQSWFLETPWVTQLLPAVFVNATKTVDI